MPNLVLKTTLILSLAFFSIAVSAQSAGGKPAVYYLKNASHDTVGVNLLISGAVDIIFNDPDSGMILAKAALDLARKTHYKPGELSALIWYAEAYHFRGDYPQALNILFDALELAKNMKSPESEAWALSYIGMSYSELGQYRQAMDYLVRSLQITEKLNGNYLGNER